MSTSVPDLSALLAAVHQSSRNVTSMIHGEGHWKCVAGAGLDLARAFVESDEGPESPDAVVIFLFGLLHDCRRHDDGSDPLHGPRAAAYVVGLQGSLLHLAEKQLESLVWACEAHTAGLTTTDPTIGICWDADRLNLVRLGVRPDRQFLSTRVSRAPDVVRRAETMRGHRMEWSGLWNEACVLLSTVGRK